MYEYAVNARSPHNSIVSALTGTFRVSRFALLTPITNLFALLLRLLFVDEAYRLVNDSKNDFGKRSLRNIDVIFSSLVSRLFSLSLSLSLSVSDCLPPCFSLCL